MAVPQSVLLLRKQLAGK